MLGLGAESVTGRRCLPQASVLPTRTGAGAPRRGAGRRRWTSRRARWPRRGWRRRLSGGEAETSSRHWRWRRGSARRHGLTRQRSWHSCELQRQPAPPWKVGRHCGWAADSCRGCGSLSACEPQTLRPSTHPAGCASSAVPPMCSRGGLRTRPAGSGGGGPCSGAARGGATEGRGGGHRRQVGWGVGWGGGECACSARGDAKGSVLD